MPDRLNSLVSTGVILEAVIFPVIPSGPHLLVVPNTFNILNTCISVHSISAGQSPVVVSQVHTPV